MLTKSFGDVVGTYYFNTNMINIKLLLYGKLKTIIGNEMISFEVEEGYNIAKLLDLLGEKFLEFKEIRKYAVCANNDAFIDEEYKIKEGDVISIILPASGG